jgi:hypothetical protein
MEKTEEITNEVTKPIFDARMQYYHVLQAHMMTLLKARADNNLFLMYSTLSGMLDMVAAFIGDENVKEVNKILETGANFLGNKDKTLRFYGERQLNVASRLIHKYSKHMMLPISVEENTAFKDEDFLKGSDL